MMKSIFLSESKVLDMDNSEIKSLETEYIMVDTAPSFGYEADTNSEGSAEVDDDSDYDYCDIALSEDMQCERCSFTFSLTEDMILEEAEQPSIRHILDEAHESASQLVSNQEMPGILESSASDVSVQSLPQAQAQEKDKETELTPLPLQTLASALAPAPTQAPTPTPAQTQPQIAVGGRMSNKKRRKKMKLLKKAAAAANAAAALASDVPQTANSTSTSTATSASLKPKKANKATPNTRYQNKRVANVAVACATETLASYKAGVKGAPKKVY